MPKYSWLILAVGYTAMLTVGSLVDDGHVPDLGWEFDDKLYHVLAYGLLTYLWFRVWQRSRMARPLLFAALLAVIYGIVLEAIQARPSIDRKWDLFDLIANTVGVVLASLIIVITKKTSVKNI